jgi:hypothetical protein
MSAVAEILAELSRCGVVVWADGERIGLKPKAALNDSLLARVQANKGDILAVLSGRPANCSLTCYEIEPGSWIHRPWDGCKTRIREFAEPIIPARADCGCAGTVCSRCWLCAEVHCGCLPKGTCWHCRGAGRCGCTACWRRFAGGVTECVVCHGSGKTVKRVQ